MWTRFTRRRKLWRPLSRLLFPGRLLILYISLGISVLYCRIGWRFRFPCRTDGSASIEAAWVGSDIARRPSVAGPNARSLAANSVLMLCFKIARVRAIAAFYTP